MKINESARCSKSCATFVLKFCFLTMMLASSAWSQTLTLTNISGFKLFAGGGGYSGAYTNIQIRAALTGDFTTTPNPVTLTASSVAGLTTVFLTNSFTNSQTLFVNFMLTNVAKGVYPITISATTNGQPVGNSMVIPLVVGTLWTNSNPAGDVTWSSSANWSGGAPASGDNVMFQDAGSSTNYLNSSVTVDSLTIIRNISATNHDFTLAPGTTLAIVGTNGFAINEDAPQTPATSKTMRVNIAGNATLLVSNSAANVAINGDSTGSTGTTLTMTNLDAFKAYVSRFGVADVKFALQGAIGAQMARVDFAKTNFIRAGYVSADLSIANTNYLDGSINFINNTMDYNNGSAYTFNLGQNNAFEGDSMIFGQARSGSASSVMQFNSLFATPSSSVSFRNIGGGRVSLLAVAADSFGPSGVGSNTKFKLTLLNGYVDMLVDTMWIARNRYTNNSSANPVGSLAFSYGIVDVNTLRLGYQAYTNDSFCNGTITVGQGTNSALLVVNNDLNLGYTSGDNSGGVNAARVWGQVVVGTNGTVQAKQITVGAQSTNNTITVQKGGLLVVSNAIADSTKFLTTLSMDGNTKDALKIFVTAGQTNIFVTNLTLVSASKINIGSISGFASYPATNVIIKYVTAAGLSGLGYTPPPGFNNIRLNDTGSSIELIINTNAPQTLVWKGPGSAWDHSSYNWVLATNTSIAAKFTDGDNVIFNDTVGVPTAITITELVSPSQAGIGIAFTNSVNNYTFVTNGAALSGITAGVLSKNGSGSVQIDGYANVTAQVNAGKLVGSGILGSVSTANGSFFGWAGEVFGSVAISGAGTNSGFFDSGITVSAGGAFTNKGTISGVFTVATNGLLYNNNVMNNFASSTVAVGGRFVNGGTITGSSLDIFGTFEDLGTTISLSSFLTIRGGGTFAPGGAGIGTTIVQDVSGNGGWVKFSNGSTNIFKVDPGAVGQKNTRLYCNLQYLGDNSGSVVTNGGIIVMNNIGATPFVNGDSFTLFGLQPSGGTFPSSLYNTTQTNNYPVMRPVLPGFGLAWDFSQVMFDGVISVGMNALPQTPTNIVVATSGNAITLSWPQDYTGWRLLSQTNALSVGLSTNWGIVAASTTTNSVTITTDPANAAVFYRLSYPYP